MILTLFKLDSVKHVKSFERFSKLLAERYAGYLSVDLIPYGPGVWYTAVKPYHSGVFPFMALDMMVQFRAQPCQLFFGHDLLTFGTSASGHVHIDDSLRKQIDRILGEFPLNHPCMKFRGFGSRIDVGLNALSNLYVDILGSLTKVESEVLNSLRSLQYERYGDPMSVRTFGLQKQVAVKLNKSPVAIHKSLRSSKYNLMADTAVAMKEMIA